MPNTTNFYKKILIILMIMLFNVVTGLCGEFEDILKKAEQGDSSAQYSLGLYYFTGKNGVRENETEAYKWIKLAAENGNASAQLFYGQYLPDKVKGFQWIMTAAENGDTTAELYLGELYRTDNNQYVAKDIAQAINWLTVAANKKGRFHIGARDKAIFRLAAMYENGDGVEKNLTKASEWLTKLIDSPLYGGATGNEQLYELGKGYKKIKTNEAIVLLRVAAERGHAGAQYELGLMYQYGYAADTEPLVGRFSLKQDKDKFLKWLHLAGENGYFDAYYKLGCAYDQGIVRMGVEEWLIERNGLEAQKYYRWAAKKGHKEAQKEIDRINKYELSIWGEWYLKNGSRTTYLDYEFNWTWFEADIAFSKAGEKRLYFSISKHFKSTCKPEDYGSNGKDFVWEFNNQAVSMIVFCTKIDDNVCCISATPRSEKGMNFVVSLLQKAPEKILVKGHGYEFPISARGFSKIWKTKSNKAL